MGRPGRRRRARRAPGDAAGAPRCPATSASPDAVAGFENVPAIVAAATALEAVRADAEREDARLRGARRPDPRPRSPRTVPDVEVVGDPDDRLPHVVTFSCLYVDGEALVTALDRDGFAVTSGLVVHVQHARAVARARGDGRR